MKQALVTMVVLSVTSATLSAAPKLVYAKKPTRHETIVASLRATGLPTLEGKWYYLGPFDNTNNKGFKISYPPEKEIDLAKKYRDKDGNAIRWQEYPKFRIGRINDLRLFPKNDFACIYLYHEFEVKAAVALPVSVGSDDGIVIWLNGERVLAENIERGAAPDQNSAELKLKAGKNRLLVKVCNIRSEWALYLRPMFPSPLEDQFRERLDSDFASNPFTPPSNSLVAAEAKFYRIQTVPVPADIALEVGGLAFRPDGKLLCCTRRGDVWLISKPDDAERVKYKLFATGLHEPLGLLVGGPRSVYIVQRPELTRLVDTDGDDVADEYQTICDKWGVSGDYHEFAFGPARDKQGNFYVTLNVGFAGNHQSRVPWRGWCVKITPKGELIPYAAGLRSPNGINFSPDGDLFYCDNQGEWVETNKMCHVRAGDFFGHQASLRWVKQSPFASRYAETLPSGMLFDGQPQPGKTEPRGMPPATPPAIWFPYGRMGQSASEPIWDTTGGKFGPFAGQCFVGDQTKSNILRVVLEKINGRYQGACFPFRSGFQCGINRLAFAPDGSLYAGQTARGWGSVGGKPYGLQRLVYNGVVPFEIHSMKLTKRGFDLTFTKPLSPATAQRLEAYSLQSFTYIYWSTYGSPEVDRRAEKVQGLKISADRRTVSLAVTGFRKGRVYELHLDGVKSAEGDALLHPEGYYTLNELP